MQRSSSSSSMALACAMAVLVLISSSLAAQAASAQPGYRPPQRPPPPYAPQGPGYSRKCPECNSGATPRAPSALAPHRKAMQAAPDVDSKTLARHATPTYI
ncbi:unnamed protein product [Triticum turgidum subsp. durum]|uniref:Epidermal patterning factor-like protein n=1 Tax=Triticum turgidum subsp. durum TaxID=4567 RepID=A0A9R0R8Y1_TRITD|nr:unnamed protein product [Triticum turgidum subsp. durum]